jgi:hypothetical protein
MILCAMPECQTTAGCMCPKRVSMSYPNADLNRVGLLQDEITRLRSELANARNAALEEAAKVAERDVDWAGFGKRDIEQWDGGPDAVRDYRLGIVAARSVAASIRALKAGGDQ